MEKTLYKTEPFLTNKNELVWKIIEIKNGEETILTDIFGDEYKFDSQEEAHEYIEELYS